MVAKIFSESSSSSSSPKPQWNLDVFLSFRGEDTRKNFTDHLYTSLIQAGIHTFPDDDEFPRGKNISYEQLKAIQESRISIVVFSKGYASSQRCLDELAEILECKKTIGQIVLPIFYDVDPSDVRKQTGCFAEAFDRHEKYFKEEMKTVKKWRETLTEAADLSGWDLQNIANGHESKFIQEIVKDVLSKLNHKYLNVAAHPVGIDSRVRDVIGLLNIGTNDVSIVGIHGMGGIGKTTIAKAVFNQLCDGFEGSCFLLNVKEVSEQPNGLVQLQGQLLCDILKSKVPKFYNVDRGINLIKERLCHKRVLVVLDDLDQLEQLNALVGERNWFGLGSRIVITTRDEHLLTQVRVDEKYQVEELNVDDSHQLFNWHAFKETPLSDDYVELSNGVVEYVGGLPLALEVLGSYLFRRSKSEWLSAIKKLKKVPHHQIQRKLRISFDTLDDDKLKDMFLDIACFFIGMDKEYVAKLLEGCGFFPEIGINILIQRSLLTISSLNKLRMHDLLQDMGREIIREMSPNHPGKRSRIWLHDDVLDVLKKQMGTEAIEGLTLDVQTSKDVFLTTESLARMRYLRLLQINAVHLKGCYEHLPTELIWLCWCKCPLKFLPPSFQLNNLVVLEMQFSNIRQLWKEIQFLNKLKILNLSHSVFLARSPNFRGLASLEELILEGCVSLHEIHQSIGYLERLVFLNLKGCKTLKNLPESICCLRSLETLNVAGCSKLEKLPENFGKMEALTELFADETSIRQLPSSFGQLKNLRNLSLGGLKDESPYRSWFSRFSLRRLPRSSNSNTLLPASFAALTSLKRLELTNGGLSENSMSINLGSLSSLEELDLAGNKFLNLPKGIGNLSKLYSLNLNSCTNLQSISELPSSLKFLHAYKCMSMERLSIQSKIAPTLFLPYCQSLVEIEGLENVENKPIVYVESCYSLSNNFKKGLLQAGSKFDFFAVCLPGSEVPDWFSHRADGSSLSFYLPTISDGEIQGLIVWAVYAATEESGSSASAPFATIRNKNNDVEFTHRFTVFPTQVVLQDHSWVSQIPFCDLPCAMEGGDELEVYFKVGYGMIIKKCGVHLMLNKQDITDVTGTVTPYTSPPSDKNSKAVRVERFKRVHDNDGAESVRDWSKEEGSSKRAKMEPDA